MLPNGLAILKCSSAQRSWVLNTLILLQPNSDEVSKYTEVQQADDEGFFFSKVSTLSWIPITHIKCAKRVLFSKILFSSSFQTGFIFNQQSIQNFLNGVADLIMNSMTHSNTKIVLENALSNFERLIEAKGSREAKEVLKELSMPKRESRETAAKKLVMVTTEHKHFSLKTMEKLLIANYKSFIGMAFCKLYETVFIETNSSLTNQLQSNLLSDF